MNVDVAIIGGGPAGSTAGSLLKKYGPSELRVAIFEREIFPREHVGESLLPPISPILAEMGCWDKVEAAGFPIKIGATYKWGKHAERWDVNFVPPEQVRDQDRPAKLEGLRLRTAFQVDRAEYDRILLDNAAEAGCSVHQGVKVVKVDREGDGVNRLILESGKEVSARYYIDASGNSGLLRRAMEVGCDYPSTLRNVAIYGYWQNADWAVEIGVDGTRIQVLSLRYGWLWFIPLGPTRTSIGLVVPAEYLKKSGKSLADLYHAALGEEPLVASLIKNASLEGGLTTTRDWSFLADRNTGENWFLIGESAGFADPILSAGVTMAHFAGRHVAYTILELDRGIHDPKWLKREFEQRQAQRIRTHIRFGDYWYTANEQFSDMKDFTVELAAETGLDLSPDKAWAWIAQGGFVDEDLSVGTGGFTIATVKAMAGMISDTEATSPFDKYNIFRLNLAGSSNKNRADYRDGHVNPRPCYVREGKVLPGDGVFEPVFALLRQTSDLTVIVDVLRTTLEAADPDLSSRQQKFGQILSAIEALVADGWVECSYDPARPLYNFTRVDGNIRWNSDPIR